VYRLVNSCAQSFARCARQLLLRRAEAAVAVVGLLSTSRPEAQGRAGSGRSPRSATGFAPSRDSAVVTSRPRRFDPQAAGETPRAFPDDRTAPARCSSSPLRSEALAALAGSPAALLLFMPGSRFSGSRLFARAKRMHLRLRRLGLQMPRSRSVASAGSTVRVATPCAALGVVSSPEAVVRRDQMRHWPVSRTMPSAESCKGRLFAPGGLRATARGLDLSSTAAKRASRRSIWCAAQAC